MLTGRRPFDGLTTADVMAAILTSDTPALPKGTAPAELERILRRCLAKKPEERWQSAGDLKTALEWVTVPKDLPLKTSGPLHRLAGVTRRRMFYAAGALAAALLLVAGGTLRNNPAGS